MSRFARSASVARDRCADGVAKPLIHKDAIGCQRHQIRDALIGVAAGARHGFDQMLVSHRLQAQTLLSAVHRSLRVG